MEDITQLMDRVRRSRDEEAVAGLWQVYYRRMVDVARRQIGNLPKCVADEEYVACSAMRSFVRAAEAGRLNTVENRDELWKVLVTITIRKANRHKKSIAALKRGGAGTHDESDDNQPHDGESPRLNSIPDERFVADLMLDCTEMISLLPREDLQRIALLRLDGYSVAEIARIQNVVNRTQYHQTQTGANS